MTVDPAPVSAVIRLPGIALAVIGSAAFMLTGPATKITNLGAMKIVLGWKRFIIYLAFTMLFALCTGLIADLF